MVEVSNCKICGSETKRIIDKQIKVTYSLCEVCDFVYKDQAFHLTKPNEHDQYDRHNNTLENEGYVNIFNNLINNHIKPLDIKRNVLEYGSGPFPAFKILLEREGYHVSDFDPFYNNNEDYKTKKYQLITSTEVVEHFYNPLDEFKHLFELLEDQGYLVIMTRFRSMDSTEFLNWWYRRDLTHVSFYNLKTFKYIAELYNAEIVSHNSVNIITFQKKNS